MLEPTLWLTLSSFLTQPRATDWRWCSPLWAILLQLMNQDNPSQTCFHASMLPVQPREDSYSIETFSFLVVFSGCSLCSYGTHCCPDSSSRSISECLAQTPYLLYLLPSFFFFFWPNMLSHSFLMMGSHLPSVYVALLILIQVILFLW